VKDEGPPWLKRLGIDRTCCLAGMCRGIVTLTATPDGTHTVWLYDYQIASGDAISMRNLYADHMRGDWLEKYYRPMIGGISAGSVTNPA